MKTLTPDQLAEISRATVHHYDAKAQTFWEATRDHDVSENRAALLRHIESNAPWRILDLGCGPGRDLVAFTGLGHEAVGLEGSAELCRLARRISGCEVWQQDFLHMDLPEDRFDGIFANAALFHVPSQELHRVLGELGRSLKTRGVLFSSNPRGNNEEGWQGARYGAFHDLERWRGHLAAAGFIELEHYYRPPGEPRHRQPWLATLWRWAG